MVNRMVKSLLEQISKDKEKLLAFMEYLIDTGRLTEDEVINIVREYEATLSVERYNKNRHSSLN